MVSVLAVTNYPWTRNNYATRDLTPSI